MNPVFGVIHSAIFLSEGSVVGIPSVIVLLLTSAGIYVEKMN